jgi:DNA-binding transcriptional LysR family regulator
MALYHRCRPLFDALGEAEEAVRSMRASLSGRLRITATPAFGRALLVPAIGDFAERHPDLSIELVFAGHRMDLVEEGIDLAVREGPLPDSGLIATKLTEMCIVLCASPGYLSRRAAPTALDGLANHDIVSVPVAGPDSDPRRIGLPNGGRLDLRPRILVNDLFSVRKLALDGRGIAPLPDYMVEGDLADGLLVQVLPDARLPRLPVTAVYPERRLQPRRVRALLDFLVERFRPSDRLSG